MRQQTPVHMAIAGLSHNHVTWLLRNSSAMTWMRCPTRYSLKPCARLARFTITYACKIHAMVEKPLAVAWRMPSKGAVSLAT